eukprot:3642211-Rhodomonas_salina.7
MLLEFQCSVKVSGSDYPQGNAEEIRCAVLNRDLESLESTSKGDASYLQLRDALLVQLVLDPVAKRVQMEVEPASNGRVNRARFHAAVTDKPGFQREVSYQHLNLSACKNDQPKHRQRED